MSVTQITARAATKISLFILNEARMEYRMKVNASAEGFQW